MSAEPRSLSGFGCFGLVGMFLGGCNEQMLLTALFKDRLKLLLAYFNQNCMQREFIFQDLMTGEI